MAKALKFINSNCTKYCFQNKNKNVANKQKMKIATFWNRKCWSIGTAKDEEKNKKTEKL